MRSQELQASARRERMPKHPKFASMERIVGETQSTTYGKIHACIQRGSARIDDRKKRSFDLPITWYGDDLPQDEAYRIITYPTGPKHIHPASPEEIAKVMDALQQRVATQVCVVLPTMTEAIRRAALYGLQWGGGVYLLPQEESLEEEYRHPNTQQMHETRKFGGKWHRLGNGIDWRLTWTKDALRDFFLYNVLMHEVGHVGDKRNSNPKQREQYANAFAIQHGNAIAEEFGVLPKQRIVKRHHKRSMF